MSQHDLVMSGSAGIQQTPSWYRSILRQKPGLLGLMAVGIALLLAVPVFGIVWSLFLEGKGNWPHIASTVLPLYVQNSLILMLGVGVLVLFFGTATAWLVVMCRFPGRRFFEWALILPLAMPAYVVAYAYTDVLQVAGPVQAMLRDLTGWRFGDYWFPRIRSMEAAIVMFAGVLYPYVYLLARNAFLNQSICVLDVGRTLGRSPWGCFWSLGLPLARPALAAGTALALMETLADFGTVAHFGIPTFTTGIFRAWASMGDRVAAAQLSSILLAFVLALLVAEQWSRSRARFHQTSQRFQEIKGFSLRGSRAVGAFCLCLLPLVIGFIAPLVMLLWMAITGGHDLFGPRYLTLLRNSVLLAGVTGLLAIAVSVFLAYAARVERSQLAAVANRIASMGYAVPGAMIAVGIFIPLAFLDNLIDGLMTSWFGISTGLLLTGGLAALVLGYLVRFLAVSLNSVQGSLVKVTPRMDDAARSLGCGPFGVVRKVHVPLITSGVLTAGLIVFVDVMKELPATLMMRPFNFDTLAVQAYNLARDERLTQAATPSLVIVAAGLLPIIILSRAIMRSRPGARSTSAC